MKDIRTTKRLIASACGLVAIAGLVAAVRWSLDPFSREPFDQAAWLARVKSPNGEFRRRLMAQDLVNTEVRPGMSADEMKKVIGEPDDVIPGDKSTGNKSALYALGKLGKSKYHPQAFYNCQSVYEAIYVRLDKNRKVVTAGILIP